MKHESFNKEGLGSQWKRDKNNHQFLFMENYRRLKNPNV